MKNLSRMLPFLAERYPGDMILTTEGGTLVYRKTDKEYYVDTEYWDLFDIKFPSQDKTALAWDIASAAYTEQVSGEIHAVVGSNLRSGNIWENVVLPRLKKNPNLTKIITIDPKTKIETVIYTK